MFSKKARKGFTLIEMLIVIVIIGILAAALIPRLSSARGRANDVARKADLAQVASALVSYQIDNGEFPTTAGALSLTGIGEKLVQAGMNGIPKDPNASRVFAGIADGATGQYSYTPIEKGGVTNGGFVLMAATETEGGSNWVQGTTEGVLNSSDDYNTIKLCTDFTQLGATGQPTNDDVGNCQYDKNGDQLRYIYVY